VARDSVRLRPPLCSSAFGALLGVLVVSSYTASGVPAWLLPFHAGALSAGPLARSRACYRPPPTLPPLRLRGGFNALRWRSLVDRTDFASRSKAIDQAIAG
jgi:hypothetical protein